ncbi:MAG: efflux RND transporter periplasmic adaptor subunit [Lachnospiraceae bacterium]|nr:efflux RND transporter periplasmic adaptor subunit [Lachnospiraceae bacterium]
MRKGEKKGKNMEGAKTNKKRKKKWLKIAIPVVIVLLLIMRSVVSSKNAASGIPVYTQNVSVGDIDTQLSISGKVMSEESTAFFAPADAKVEEIEVQKGDVVKAGDVLLCFDKEAVAYAKQKSELEGKISSADYNSTVQYNNEQRAKLTQAEADIATYQAMVDRYEQYIDDLTNGITDVTALRRADLYAKIYSTEKEMNAYDLAMQIPEEDTDFDALTRKKVEKQNELNKLNNELSLISDYKTDYGWEDMLTQAKKDLSDYEELLSEAKNAKSSAEAALENGTKMAGYELNREKAALESEDAQKKYEKVLNGFTADYNGVVSELSVEEGAPVQEGAKCLTLESIDNVCVEFQASKYALETLAIGQPAEIIISGKSYTGSVTKINHIAEENSSGTATVAARVHIDNPDENIFLGLDAKLKILTASEKGVLQVPVEAVNVDSQGEFCYLIENGVLVKKYVTIGISSETYIQILDGLSKDQEIVTTAVGGIGLDEGMSVTGMPVPDMDGAGMEDVDTGSVGTENTAVGGAETEGTDAETQSATQEHTEDEADNG